VLDYVRIYPAAGDTEPIEWERLVRQRQVIAALRDQIGRPETMARLPTLVPQFYYDAVSDLSLKQVLSLACLLQGPDLSIEHLSLAPGMVTVGPDHVLTPDMEEITSFLESSFIQ
jgi:hypothetical protein